MKGMRRLVVKALPVDGIDAIKFDASGVDEIGERADQSLAFKFPFVAGAGGKTEEWLAPVAVNDHPQLHSQAVRIPAMEFTFHQSDLFADNKFEEARVCQRCR